MEANRDYIFWLLGLVGVVNRNCIGFRSEVLGGFRRSCFWSWLQIVVFGAFCKPA